MAFVYKSKIAGFLPQREEKTNLCCQFYLGADYLVFYFSLSWEWGPIAHLRSLVPWQCTTWRRKDASKSHNFSSLACLEEFRWMEMKTMWMWANYHRSSAWVPKVGHQQAKVEEFIIYSLGDLQSHMYLATSQSLCEDQKYICIF